MDLLLKRKATTKNCTICPPKRLLLLRKSEMEAEVPVEIVVKIKS